MSLIDDAKNQVGECFFVGFAGTSLSDDTSAFISQARIGGVILFKHNYESPGQIAELTQQVQDCRAEYPLFVSVDQEGGRVQRFGAPGFTKLPTAAAIGKCDSPQIAFDVARISAAELKAVGVNVNFAPVCDINTNPKNPVIGDRSYGDEEDRVSRMVTAMVRGYLMGGVQPCMKHFPGHGDTDKDSHFDLPRVTTKLETLREREFRPFTRAAKSRCAMLMTAHIMVPELDPKNPATLSPHILRKILREELRYSRVILSDDMEMKAMTDHFGEQAPVRALAAGCDGLLYRSEAAGRSAYETVLKALENGTLDPKTVLESVERLQSLKKSALMPYEPLSRDAWKTVVASAEHQAIVAKVEATA